jgi:hypothetical protein
MHKAALSFVTLIAVAFALCSPALARGGNSGGGGSATTASSHATSSSGGNHQPQSQQQAASKQKSKGGKSGQQQYLKYNFSTVYTTKSSGAGAGKARFNEFTITKGSIRRHPNFFRNSK